MPEDSHPIFEDQEKRLAYFTLPMALNYQRDSYSLWESALKSYEDQETQKAFLIESSAQMPTDQLRELLLKHRLALQPNKHVSTWQTLSKTIFDNCGSFENFFYEHEKDFLKIKKTIQKDQKKLFPYLSGPKIFNYWSFIINTFGGINLKNKEYIEIAPDTHIIKCSVLLGVVSPAEANVMSRDQISERWRKMLDGCGISPIEMHSPLWFWSKNNFRFKVYDNH